MSKQKYDYLVVGAGLSGAVFAREAQRAGKQVLVIDKSTHVAGHCYTENVNGVNVHVYGPHIFHTSNKRIWGYVNQFADFNHFVNRPKVSSGDKLYSFPINLMTLHQLWGVKTPGEAQAKLAEVREPIENPKNLEEWILSQVGREIYDIFIKGYTTKQWGREPKALPASIIQRLPIRLTYDDNYYSDRYQGIPVGGYTQLVENMLQNVPVDLNTDFFDDQENFQHLAKKIIYTGPIYRYFDYSEGILEYRSLRFERFTHKGDFQGNAVVNFGESSIPYTRIVEHKHFEFNEQTFSVLTREYPDEWTLDKEPYYPINDSANNEIYNRYRAKAANYKSIIFTGRLGNYKYYDMHHVIGAALRLAKEELAV